MKEKCLEHVGIKEHIETEKVAQTVNLPDTNDTNCEKTVSVSLPSNDFLLLVYQWLSISSYDIKYMHSPMILSFFYIPTGT